MASNDDHLYRLAERDRDDYRAALVELLAAAEGTSMTRWERAKAAARIVLGEDVTDLRATGRYYRARAAMARAAAARPDGAA